MQQYLAKYFSLYRQLALPGIGMFKTTVTPAQVEFTEKLLHPPVCTVSFHANENTNDQQLVPFIMNETGFAEQEAAGNLHHFISQLQSKLKEGFASSIAGIGVLNHDGKGYTFTPGNFQQLYPPVVADKVLRKNAQHNIRVGEDHKTSAEMQVMLHKEITQDRWWIAALVLGLVGVAAILYHYISRSS